MVTLVLSLYERKVGSMSEDPFRPEFGWLWAR